MSAAGERSLPMSRSMWAWERFSRYTQNAWKTRICIEEQFSIAPDTIR